MLLLLKSDHGQTLSLASSVAWDVIFFVKYFFSPRDGSASIMRANAVRDVISFSKDNTTLELGSFEGIG